MAGAWGFRVAAGIFSICLGAAGWAGAGEAEGVPSRAKMDVEGPSGISYGKLERFVSGLLKDQIQRARREIAEFKREREERKRKEAEAMREAARRREAIGGAAPVEKKTPASTEETYRVSVNLNVPELALYRSGIRALRHQSAVCAAATAFLAELDKDGDEKLTGEEYKRALALYKLASRALQPLDRNGDGIVSDREIEALLAVPRNVKEAVEKALEAGRIENVRIPVYDRDRDGTLDLSEAKDFAMGFASAAIAADSDRAFYATVVDAIREAERRVMEELRREIEE
ncbi:MAG: hypothetical protein N3A38_04475 [Planctomycetota bacterium]|nr:hypothetical protein [Planctomycetota bacterium]